MRGSGRELRQLWGRIARMGALLLLGPLVSCANDTYEEGLGENGEWDSGTIGLELNLRTQVSTLAATGYEDGTTWENYLDLASGDYRIYFFTYDPMAETGAGKGINSTLIATFAPTDILTEEGTDYARYTLSGAVDDELAGYTNLKVVVAANWGSYPTVEEGTTTIDDICKAETAVFNAFVANGEATLPSATLHIPFYGVREYSGLRWRQGQQTTLSGDITLLRAVAKVEVILNNPDVTFTEVAIQNYNAQGYCAPEGVYLRADYDHDYSWSSDFVSTLHLVNGGYNDADAVGKSFSFTKVQERAVDAAGEVTQYETWVAYLPEYDNSSTGYCYITAKFDYQGSGENPNNIYFAEYSGGTTDNSVPANRYDICRNNLYRFTVSLSGTILQVWVNKWENTYDNEFDFDREVEVPDSGTDSGTGSGTDEDTQG